MARYRKVDPRIWNDKKFRALTDDGKLAFLFLLTHPQMTALGAMRATLAGLADELGWEMARMRDAMSYAIRHGMCVVNAEAKFVGLPNFLKYNAPEGPNSVTKAWIDALDLVPECLEKTETITRCRKYLEGKSDAFRHAIGDAIWDAFPEPCPILEQEQEQELEQEQDTHRAPTVPVEPKKPPVLTRVTDPRVASLTPDQLGQLKAAHPDGTYRQSSWLTGERNANFHLNEGHTFEQMLAGERRYMAQCRAKGIVGTQYVMSPDTMYDRRTPQFMDPFPIPAAVEQPGRGKTYEQYMANLDAEIASHDEENHA